MSATTPKRSIIVNGVRTSCSLEDEFWDAYRDLAGRRGKTLNEFAEVIHAWAAESRPGTNLSSAMRIYVLLDLQAQIRAYQTDATP